MRAPPPICPLACAQGDDSIVIAKMDATANDIPTDKMAVRGYPTLFFVKADGEGELQGARRGRGGCSPRHAVHLGRGPAVHVLATCTHPGLNSMCALQG